MARLVAIYAIALALAAMALEWLQARFLVGALSTPLYIALLAAGFGALGIWAGRRIAAAPRPPTFVRNAAAVRSLGLTPRECDILDRLATGQSIKELARSLQVSPNTVKTHVARVYEKLGVGRRVQAIEKARQLALIP